MPHTDTTPVSASIVSLGKGIRYIGSHIYAASGEINPNNSTLRALEFTTGSGYILAKVYWGVDLIDFDTNKDVGLFIKLNNLLVYQTRGQAHLGGSFDGQLGNIKIEFLIPSQTLVEIDVSTNQTNTVGQTILLTGRVYGAE